MPPTDRATPREVLAKFIRENLEPEALGDEGYSLSMADSMLAALAATGAPISAEREVDAESIARAADAIIDHIDRKPRRQGERYLNADQEDHYREENRIRLREYMQVAAPILTAPLTAQLTTLTAQVAALTAERDKAVEYAKGAIHGRDECRVHEQNAIEDAHKLTAENAALRATVAEYDEELAATRVSLEKVDDPSRTLRKVTLNIAAFLAYQHDKVLAHPAPDAGVKP